MKSNYRTRRRAARAARPVTKEYLWARLNGLIERIRKARAGIGAGAQGDVEAKIVVWLKEYEAIKLELNKLIDQEVTAALAKPGTLETLQKECNEFIQQYGERVQKYILEQYEHH